MPFEIVLPERPLGYALDPASGVEGNPVRVAIREFVSSEDGEIFISRLEGWPSKIVALLPKIRPSQIDHLFAVIRNDLTATVYVNELPISASVRVTRPVQAGEEATLDDIGDIKSVNFGVSVPPEAAV